MSTPITILDKGATQSLDAIHNAVAPGKRRPLMMALGSEAEGIYRRHFRSREMDSPNKQGWPRQHFWSRIRKATALDTARTTDSSASLVIADRAINAKIYGGVIRPRERKFLAIPLRPEAYGVMPSANTIEGIFVLRSKFGRVGALLVRREGKKLVAYWRLTPRVTVSADSRALPPPADVNEQLVQTATSFLMRSTTKLNSPSSD